MPSTDRNLELKARHRWLSPYHRRLCINRPSKLSRLTDDCVGERVKLPVSALQPIYFLLLHLYYVCCQAHPPTSNYHNNIMPGECYKLRNSSLRDYARPFALPTSSYNKIIMTRAGLDITACSWTLPVWLVPSVFAPVVHTTLSVSVIHLSSVCAHTCSVSVSYFVGNLIIKL
jgi:hypothetical protein